jgi:anaphase-promoting complex subunit 1
MSGLEVPAQQIEPPSIYDWVEKCLRTPYQEPFLMLADLVRGPRTKLNDKIGVRASSRGRLEMFTPRTQKIVELFLHISTRSQAPTDIVQKMVDLGFDNYLVDTLPEGIATPLRDAIAACQPDPPTTWKAEALHLVGRDDLKLLLFQDQRRQGHSSSQAVCSLHRREG